MNHPAPEFFADIPLPSVSGTASGRSWVLREADLRAVSTLIQKAGLEPVVARALIARGVDVNGAEDYLVPTLRNSLPDPYVLKDMETASEVLTDAILNDKGIGVFGDYDVDGTSAASILRLYFEQLGKALPVYLPDRIMEGYGPSIDAFRSLKNDGADIIVTVDCGAAAHQVIEDATGEGMGVVVLDHHLMSGPPPAGALAVVNPNRPDDISGLTNLSAAGVAFMMVVALNRSLRKADFFEKGRSEPDLTRLLDLTALGLVCDVMEMRGLTRVLVAQGLKVLGKFGSPGLKALADRAGAKGEPSTYHLGFLIGPRINAAGRIGHANLAFELLTTPDPSKRAELAERLHVMNAERQVIEADVQLAALQKIELENLSADNVIVVAGEGWHPGVIGIVAGRVKEKFDKPVIVIGLDGDTGKGSGRSISGVDLGSSISAAREEGILINGGGHAMAAGLTVAAAQLPDLRARLNADLGNDVIRARQNRQLKIDGVIAASAVTKTFARLVEKAGPYGPGNPEPIFALSDLRVRQARTVGENHISLVLENNEAEQVRAIAFRAEGEPLGDVLRNNPRVHIAGKVRADDWRGGDAGQLQITDAAPAQ